MARKQTPPDYNPLIGYSQTGAPILRAERYAPDGALRVWCVHCQRWHYHGKGEGHRIAHCRHHGGNPESPYLQTGYILREVKA